MTTSGKAMLARAAVTLSIALVAQYAGAAPWAGEGSVLNPNGSGVEARVVYHRRSVGPTHGTNGVTILPGGSKVVDGNSSHGIDGYTTWNLTVQMFGNAKNAYTIYGSPDAPLIMPPVYKCNCAPFGSNIGGTNPAFWKYKPEAQWDSWLTIGITDGNQDNAISSVGFSYETWCVFSQLTPRPHSVRVPSGCEDGTQH